MSIRYKSTSTTRYMWGIGVVCALLVLTITGSWVVEGRLPYRVRSFGAESKGAITKQESPFLFWAIGGLALAAGGSALIITSLGLRRIQRDETEQRA